MATASFLKALKSEPIETLRDRIDALRPLARAHAAKRAAGGESTPQIAFGAATYEAVLREVRRRQADPQTGLLDTIRYFWPVLEPVDPFVEGWPLECLCAHLQAITNGDTIHIGGEEKPFNRFLCNVPPGFMKSLCVNVFWPAWEWGPREMPHLRYVCFSYNSDLTVRDNTKFRDLIVSELYQELWGHVFTLVADGVIRIRNDKTGSKFATSFGGTGTGERGHRVLLDDPHKIKGTQETDDARQSVTNWVREGMQNRLNDLTRDVIVVIMQRVHEADSSGTIMEHLGDEYCHLIIPMAYERGRHFSHYAGWNNGHDPRDHDGELAWANRYPPAVLRSYQRNSYLWSGQYQQNPVPRGGGIFKEDWWQPYVVPTDGMYDFVPVWTGAFLDTAFKEEEENDYSALVVLTVYDAPKTGHRRIMLTDAWKKRLPLHGVRTEKRQDEDERAYLRRAAPKWGLCEWVAYTCTKRRVERLVVEDSARGHDVNAEIRRLYANRDWGVVMMPARGDKWSRANAVVDLFVDDMVFAPGEWMCPTHAQRDCKECAPETFMWTWRDFASEVINEMCSFPRGAHDDLVDAMVMGLRHLREIGLAIRREERQILEKEMAMFKPRANASPLYPC